MQDIVEKAKQTCQATIENMGYELVDVDYIREEGQMCLNFYIYKPEGISLDNCEAVSKALDPLLDEADPTQGKPYCLCVSSPGERPFKTERDFQRNLNKTVEIKLKQPLGKKHKLKGELISFDETTVVIKGEKGETAVPRDNIVLIKPYIGF